MERLLVERRAPLPDFRVLVAFLWGDWTDVDTEGDCRHPADRDWTELQVRNRETGESVELLPATESPNLLVVGSASPELTARVAYFMAVETSARVFDHAGGVLETAALLPRLGSAFSVEEARGRAEATRFRRATEADPYSERE